VATDTGRGQLEAQEVNCTAASAGIVGNGWRVNFFEFYFARKKDWQRDGQGFKSDRQIAAQSKALISWAVFNCFVIFLLVPLFVPLMQIGFRTINHGLKTDFDQCFQCFV